LAGEFLRTVGRQNLSLKRTGFRRDNQGISMH
jgi:hypothetical protein